MFILEILGSPGPVERRTLGVKLRPFLQELFQIDENQLLIWIPVGRYMGPAGHVLRLSYEGSIGHLDDAITLRRKVEQQAKQLSDGKAISAVFITQMSASRGC